MKAVFVSGLQPDQVITSFFLVCDKEIRNTREGRSYLCLELGDRTGTVEARMWDGFEREANTFKRDDFVKVQGRVEVYRNRMQMSLDKIRRAEEHEIETGDFFRRSAEDAEKLCAKLAGFVDGMKNPWLRRLLTDVMADPDFGPRFKRAPAAKSMHHAYLGGLLEHVVSLCGLCRAVAGHYPEVDADLLIAGAMLHDVGKVVELSYERSLGYTDEGTMLGHIVIGCQWITGKIDVIEGFPPNLKTLLQHMVISHHGEYEFGSPKLPMFREALLLHFLDNLDSKMAAVREALAAPPGEGNWTAWSSALERRFLRTELFCQEKNLAAVSQNGRDKATPDVEHPSLFEPKP